VLLIFIVLYRLLSGFREEELLRSSEDCF